MRGKLTGNASGDDNNVGAGQGVLQAVILGQVAREFLPTMLENKAARLTQESIADVTYSDGGDVREIGSNTRSVDNIVEGKLVNKRAGLQEERQGLYRTTMKVRFDWHISQRKGGDDHTCPIPPEAPRTAVFKGHGVSNESCFHRVEAG